VPLTETLALSDHTKTNELGAAAVALDYTVFEKHIKFDFTSPDCPDYNHSLTVAEFANYVATLKVIAQVVSQTGKPQTDFDERVGARRGKDGLRPNAN
jgi:sialic acid synthase SpsE